MSVEKTAVIELNVGGVYYSTTQVTLGRYKDSRLPELLTSPDDVSGRGGDSTTTLVTTTDSVGRRFVDRDGQLFRYVLDYARTGSLILPEACW